VVFLPFVLKEQFVRFQSMAASGFQAVAIGGVDSPYIKGIYTPSSNQFEGNFPVFNKKDSKDHKLIFVSKSSKWKIQENRSGKWVTLAKVLCRPPGAPETIVYCWEVRSENSRGFRYLQEPNLKVATRK
jgi:hypothetical protein